MSRFPVCRGAAVALLLLLAPLAPAQDRYPSVLSGLSARCIGPANMGGRVTELAVVESNQCNIAMRT